MPLFALMPDGLTHTCFAHLAHHTLLQLFVQQAETFHGLHTSLRATVAGEREAQLALGAVVIKPDVIPLSDVREGNQPNCYLFRCVRCARKLYGAVRLTLMLGVSKQTKIIGVCMLLR